jgi:GTPase SAR1 family protein
MIMGDSGSGKTTLLKHFIDRFSKKWTCYIYNTDYEIFIMNDWIKPIKPDFNKNDDIEYLGDIITQLRAKKNNFVFAVTDLDKFYDKSNVLSTKSNPIKDLYGTGRHQRILAIVETKQPRYIPSKILANTNLFYISKFTEIEDVKRLRNYADSGVLSSLNRYEFLEIDKWTMQRRIVKLDNGQIKVLKELNPANKELQQTQEPQQEDLDDN